jgi:hypothetical protein
MAGKPGIVSVGKRSDYSRDQWGSRDVADDARMREQIEKLGPVAQPDVLAPTFTLFPERKPRHDARSRYVTDLLKAHGIR